MKLPASCALPFVTLLLLTAGSATAKDRPESQPRPVTGPAADYPVVVGEPFAIGSTVWTPTEQLNYDAVGYASVGIGDLPGVTAAHKTLPLPSYVEVTGLDTGRTILVRVERRGPMVNDVLIELSPAAASQLGLGPDRHAQVRVRRVNPPEQERAMLRSGNRAPERMETPDGLLKVLRRKLADQSQLLPPPSTPPKMPAAAPPAEALSSQTANGKSEAANLGVGDKTPNTSVANTRTTKPSGASTHQTHPSPLSGTDAAATKSRTPNATNAGPEKGSLAVQVAALSVEANARRLADQLGGRIYHVGKLWQVRMGPFANRAQASAALEKARKAGYRDARIQSAN